MIKTVHREGRQTYSRPARPERSFGAGACAAEKTVWRD